MARNELKGSWTKDDVKELKKLFPNRPTAEVAAELGRPTEAVKKKASQNGTKEVQKVHERPGEDVIAGSLLLALPHHVEQPGRGGHRSTG